MCKYFLFSNADFAIELHDNKLSYVCLLRGAVANTRGIYGQVWENVPHDGNVSSPISMGTAAAASPDVTHRLTGSS